MHSDKHNVPNFFHVRPLCNILYENVPHESLDNFLPFTFEDFPAILFFFCQTFSLVSCCILLNSFPAHHKVISHSSSLSVHMLSVYFFILPQTSAVVWEFPQALSLFLQFLSDKCCLSYLFVSLKYSSNSSLWLQHVVLQGSCKPFLLFKIKWFSIALPCSLQNSFLLWLPFWNIIYFFCSHSLLLRWILSVM